jgi:hypothetical protein
MDTTCYESSILELWAHDGSYDDKSDAAVARLTEEQILDRINCHNTR